MLANTRRLWYYIQSFLRNPVYHVKELYIYPIKSCQGIPVDHLQLTDSGILYDRMFCLVSKGNVLTMRKCHKLATLRLEFRDGVLVVTAPKLDPLHISLDYTGDIVNFKICDTDRSGYAQSEHVNNWFTTAIGRECKLVKINRSSFTDDADLLLTNIDSLKELNNRLEKPVGMDRFRPNVVIVSDPPGAGFVEDHLGDIVVGTTRLNFTHYCGRCAMITIDQRTGVMAKDYQPIKELRKFRIFPDSKEYKIYGEHSPLFGVKFSCIDGCIKIGDEIKPV